LCGALLGNVQMDSDELLPQLSIIDFISPPAPNGVRYLRWGGRRNAVRTEKAEAKKLPKNAQTPQRQVHAVLGGCLLV
jgi:hypothetical protein